MEYASAWLVAKLKTDYLNIGICKEFHGDIQYYYAVYPDKIEVYNTTNGRLDDLDPAEWKLIDTVPL